MGDLTTNFAGIQSPNPFWLASAPPTNTGDQVMRARNEATPESISERVNSR